MKAQVMNKENVKVATTLNSMRNSNNKSLIWRNNAHIYI
jgi:hypothetical protein